MGTIRGWSELGNSKIIAVVKIKIKAEKMEAGLKLTPKQERVLGFIRQRVAGGIPPTIGR